MIGGGLVCVVGMATSQALQSCRKISGYPPVRWNSSGWYRTQARGGRMSSTWSRCAIPHENYCIKDSHRDMGSVLSVLMVKVKVTDIVERSPGKDNGRNLLLWI